MITLYTFGPAFGLPDPSPFVTKAEMLLKLAGLPYRTDAAGFSKAPKGKLPYIEDDGARIADSTFIRFHIEKKYRFDFDRGLNAEQRGTAWAFEKMAEDHLYWIGVHARWIDDNNFQKGPAKFFDRVPALVRPLAIAFIRRKLRNTLHGQGIGRHSPEEITALGMRDVQAIADHLGDKPYFMGDAATGADATMFGFAAATLCPVFESPVRTVAEGYQNLRRYVGRITRQYYPEIRGWMAEVA